MSKKCASCAAVGGFVRRHRNLQVLEAGSCRQHRFVGFGIVAGQVDERLHAERGEVGVIAPVRLSAAIVARVHPSEVVDAYGRKIARLGRGRRHHRRGDEKRSKIGSCGCSTVEHRSLQSHAGRLRLRPDRVSCVSATRMPRGNANSH